MRFCARQNVSGPRAPARRALLWSVHQQSRSASGRSWNKKAANVSEKTRIAFLASRSSRIFAA